MISKYPEDLVCGRYPTNVIKISMNEYALSVDYLHKDPGSTLHGIIIPSQLYIFLTNISSLNIFTSECE